MRKSIVVADEFLEDPIGVRQWALGLDYKRNPDFYKGMRADFTPSGQTRADVCSLLGIPKMQDLYACCQLTTAEDPIVYHSDHQKYAGAIYLDPQRTDAGTSFWKNRKFGHRRPSGNPFIDNFMYSPPHLVSPDSWELVDRIGSVFNRILLWEGQLVHSATTYEGFTDDHPRLAMLFFFN